MIIFNNHLILENRQSHRMFLNAGFSRPVPAGSILWAHENPAWLMMTPAGWRQSHKVIYTPE